MFKYTKAKYKLDIVFPNKEYGGVYSLGPLIIYNVVNNLDNWHCERVFLDKGKITAPLVGFTLQWELDLKKAIAMKPKEGITFAGGPLANMNPELVSQYFDFLILGDVEGILEEVLTIYEEDQENFLNTIKDLKGIYVKGKKEKTFNEVQDLNTIPYPIVQPYPKEITKDFVFGKAFILEIERSCPYACHFCPLPTFYNKYKYRSLETIKEIINQGIKINKPERIIIYSPSFVHPQRKEILKFLHTIGLRISVPSIKAEHMDEETLTLIQQCGQESITIAPEAAESLRFRMNKKVKDDMYFKFIEKANNAQVKKLKIYMLLGLPTMTEEDLKEWVAFVKEIKKRFNGKLSLSINYFVPKPTTPFKDHVFDKKELKKQAAMIKKEVKDIPFKMPSLATSYREWQIAHGHLD